MPDWADPQVRPCPPAAADGTAAAPPTWACQLGDRRLRQQWRRRRRAHASTAPRCKEAAGAFLTALADPLQGPPGHCSATTSGTRCNYSPEVDYSRATTKAAFRDWLQGEVRRPRDARPRPGTATATPSGRTSSRRAQIGALSRSARLAAVQARQLLRPDAVAHRHHPRGRQGLPDRGPRRWRRHPQHGGRAAATTGSPPPRSRSTASPGCQRAGATSPGSNFYGVDITRAAARGKTFWHAERRAARSGCSRRSSAATRRTAASPSRRISALWTHDLVRRRRHRRAEPALAAAARRPAVRRLRLLRHGRLAHAALGRWRAGSPNGPTRPSRRALWAARPVQGDIGILVVPEAQAFDYLLNHERTARHLSPRRCGAPIAASSTTASSRTGCTSTTSRDYETLYCPYPIMLTAEHAERLAATGSEKGGTLICRGAARLLRRPRQGRHACSRTSASTRSSAHARTRSSSCPTSATASASAWTATRSPAAASCSPISSPAAASAAASRDGRLAAVEHTFGAGPDAARRHASLDRLFSGVGRAEPALLRRMLRLDRQDAARVAVESGAASAAPQGRA